MMKIDERVGEEIDERSIKKVDWVDKVKGLIGAEVNEREEGEEEAGEKVETFSSGRRQHG
jgi:hypothetical protein